MPSIEDVYKVKKGGKGAKEAFVRLIKASEVSMYRVAKSFVRSDDLVADVMQEAILKAYSGIGALREPKYFKTWLIRIVINECKNMLRNNEKVIPLGEWVEHSGVAEAPTYAHLEIEEALSTLHEDHRVAITLYYLDDMLVKDIATLLDIPEGTVKSRLSKAREQLKELLRNDERGMSYDFR